MASDESPDDEYLTPIQATLRAIERKVKTMTDAEFRESLVRAGIITEDGELTAPYRPAKKKSPRKPSPTSTREGDPGGR